MWKAPSYGLRLAATNTVPGADQQKAQGAFKIFCHLLATCKAQPLKEPGAVQKLDEAVSHQRGASGVQQIDTDSDFAPCWT